ncbi:MAG: hypothetical protein M0036_08255 [Desulfobacteraceae bacterium]|nr:hypothetical protein [Desulfobacteraceae bacterium]
MMPNQDQPGKTDHGSKAPTWAALVVDILNAPEVRQILTDVSVAWLQQWSGGSLLKKSAGKPTAWALAKTLSAHVKEDLPTVFEKPEHVEALSKELPTILRETSAIVSSALRAVEALPVERKKALLNNLFAVNPVPAHSPLLTSLSRILEDIYKDDPNFFSTCLAPWLTHSIVQCDFGELKGLFDTAKADLETLLAQAAGLLFEYPAKLIALVSLIPGGANVAVAVLNSVLGHMNSLPPDILTDLFLTLIRQVDGAAIGKSINSANEVIRQIHTGSTLIGEIDAPRFSTDLKEKIRDIMTQIDPVLAIKARNALIDGRETVVSVLIQSAQDQPQLLNLWLHQLAVKRNSNIRLLKQKLQVFESLSEEDTKGALASGLSSWNAYDLAEMVNTVGRTLHRIHQLKPELFPALVAEFADSLNHYELQETIEQFSRDLGPVVRPVFRMAAPPIIKELSGFFDPGEEDDGYDEAMEEARHALKKVLLGEEKS